MLCVSLCKLALFNGGGIMFLRKWVSPVSVVVVLLSLGVGILYFLDKKWEQDSLVRMSPDEVARAKDLQLNLRSVERGDLIELTDGSIVLVDKMSQEHNAVHIFVSLGDPRVRHWFTSPTSVGDVKRIILPNDENYQNLLNSWIRK